MKILASKLSASHDEEISAALRSRFKRNSEADHFDQVEVSESTSYQTHLLQTPQ